MRLTWAAVAAGVLATTPAAALAALDYVKPVRGPIVRHFEAPATPYGPGHRGIDIEAPAGSTVVASADGIVAFAGPVAGSLFVSVDHPDGIRTTYSFLSRVLVRAGQRVRQGEPIGRSGPGHAGAAPAHLHFGARIGETYVDPEPLLVASLRRNQWRALRLAPVERAGVASRARVVRSTGAGTLAAVAAGLVLVRRAAGKRVRRHAEPSHSGRGPAQARAQG